MHSITAGLVLVIVAATFGTALGQEGSRRSFAPGLATSDKSAKQIDSVTLKQSGQLTGTSSRPTPGKPFGPSEVVAIVGNEPILVGDMLFKVNQWIQENMRGAPPEVLEDARRNVIRGMTDQFINERMLYQDGIAGLPDGVDVDEILKQAEKEFDENALPNMMKQSKIDTPTAYDAHLRAMGSSLQQFRRAWAKEQLAGHLVRQKLKINDDISHAELLDYYHKNIEDFKHPTRARWEELMVRFDRFPVSNHAAAEAEIKRIGDLVVYGASFKAVAKESSHGFTAIDGGQFDWTTPGSLVSKNIDEAIFKLPLNYLSDIIESEFGFHIIRVLEREESHTTQFRDAQPEIREKMMDARRRAAIQAHIESLRKKIPYEVVFKQVGQP